MQNADLEIRLAADLRDLITGFNKGVSAFNDTVREMRTTAKKGTDEIEEAFDDLGSKSLDGANKEVKRLEGNYQKLVSSGKLSASEQARAYALTQRQISKVRSEVSLLAPTVEEVRGRFTTFLAAGAAVGGFLAISAGDAREFGVAINEVDTLLSDTTSINDLAEQTRRLSREFGQSNVSSARALYGTISAGAMSSADAVQILTVANRLAQIGITDVDVALDAIQPQLNAYGAGVDQAQHFSNLLFQAVRDGRTTIPELAANLGQVSPIAAQTGVSFDQLLASVAALTKGGLTTSQAITQLRAIISAVIKPTSEAQKLAKDLGLEFNAASLQTRGLSGFLDHLNERTGGTTENLSVLFGQVEGLSGALALTGSASQSFTDSLDNMTRAGDSAKQAFDKLQDTPDAAIRRFASEFEDLRTTFGNVVLSLTPVLDVITQAIKSFNDLDPAVRDTAAGVVTAVAVFGTLALGVRTLLPLLSLATSLMTANAAGALTMAAGANTASTALVGTAAAAGAARIALLAVGWIAIAAEIAFVTVEANKLIDAQENLISVQESLIDEQGKFANRIRETIQANREYRDTAVKTAEELAGLRPETGLTEYTRSLEGAVDLWRAVLASSRQTGNDAGVERARDKVKEYEAALADAQKQQRLFSVTVDDAGNAVTRFGNSGQEASADVKRFFRDIGVDAGRASNDVSDALRKGTDDLVRFARTGELTGREVSASFRQLVQSASTLGEIEALTNTLDELNKLGVLNNQEYKKFSETLGQLKVDAADAAKGLDGVGASAQRSGEQAARAGQSAAQGVAAAANAAEDGIERAANGLKRTQTQGGGFASFIRRVLDDTRALSEGASEAIDGVIERLNRRLVSTPSSFLRALSNELTVVHEGFQQQTAAADAAIAKYEETGRASAALSRAVSLTTASFQLLDQQRLDRLTAIIQEARNVQRQFNAEAAQGRLQLEEELLSLQGRELELIRLRRQRQREEIQAKLFEAQQNNAFEAVAQLEQQLRLLDRIEKIEVSKRSQEIRERREREGEGAGPPPTTQTPGIPSRTNTPSTPFPSTPSTTSSGPGTVTVVFQSPDGLSVGGQFDQASVADVLEILRRSGATTSV